MRIKIDVAGEEDLLRRLTSLAELPGIDLALDRAAEISFAAARAELVRADENEIAASLTVTTAADGTRRIGSDHPRAWYAENGTRRRPALRWLRKSARAGGIGLRQAVNDVVSGALRRISAGGR